MVQTERNAGHAQDRRPGKAGHCVRWARPWEAHGQDTSHRERELREGYLAFPGEPGGSQGSR